MISLNPTDGETLNQSGHVYTGYIQKISLKACSTAPTYNVAVISPGVHLCLWRVCNLPYVLYLFTCSHTTTHSFTTSHCWMSLPFVSLLFREFNRSSFWIYCFVNLLTFTHLCVRHTIWCKMKSNLYLPRFLNIDGKCCDIPNALYYTIPIMSTVIIHLPVNGRKQ